MRPSTFRPQTVLTGAGFALPDQEKLATVYGNMSKAPKGASTARLLPTCPIVVAKAAGGERIKMQLVMPAAIAGSNRRQPPAGEQRDQPPAERPAPDPGVRAGLLRRGLK